MLGSKIETLLAVAEYQNFTKAADSLSLTQPAVSHHISQLEEELGVTLFIRGKGSLMLTPEGEIVLKYARRIKALYGKMETAIDNSRKQLTKVRIGITHTSESNLITEVLARCSNADNNFSITIITDTINNLYDMLDNYEIDLAIVDGTPTGHSFCSLMLATDYLVCVMSIRHPLAKRAMVTLSELKQERMILRLPTSDTRMLFESTLKSIGDSIDTVSANHLIQQLCERKAITAGEAAIMRAAVSPQALSLPVTAQMKDAQRARILKSMLMEVAHKSQPAQS